RMKFIDELNFMVGYRFANLASAQGRWTTADLIPVGASQKNASMSLGHEIDAALKFSPWKPIEFEGGYGLFMFGAGGQQILSDTGRHSKLTHWGYLQTIVHAP